MLRKICNHPDLALYDINNLGENKKDRSMSSLDEPDYDKGYGFWKRSGKMIVVEGLLRMWKEQNRRVLLFTQSKQVCALMSGDTEFCNGS